MQGSTTSLELNELMLHVSMALYDEGLSEISLVNSSFKRAVALQLISYCTHLSIKAPWRVCPLRTEADIKCSHGGKKGWETDK